jgi:hypothetical protein
MESLIYGMGPPEGDAEMLRAGRRERLKPKMDPPTEAQSAADPSPVPLVRPSTLPDTPLSRMGPRQGNIEMLRAGRALLKTPQKRQHCS